MRVVSINDTLCADGVKEIVKTTESKEFESCLTAEEAVEYAHALLTLHDAGRLSYPFAEKLGGEDNLFAIRIRKGGNARFFYAYDEGTAVWILNGYEKKTEDIPRRELKRARQLKRKYGL